jgi:hypothetical protein
MDKAGSHIGVRHWSEVWVDRAVAAGQASPPLTSVIPHPGV